MEEKIPMHAAELTPYSFHISIEVRAGRRKARLIVDTGASQTVISSKLIRSLKLETAVPEMNNITVGIGQGSLNPEFSVLKTLTIGSVKVKNLPCIVLPMDHINSTYKSIGQKSIDGILGNDLLIALNAKIDMKKLTLSIRTERSVLDFAGYIRDFLSF
jgi:hypothetical protein